MEIVNLVMENSIKGEHYNLALNACDFICARDFEAEHYLYMNFDMKTTELTDFKKYVLENSQIPGYGISEPSADTYVHVSLPAEKFNVIYFLMGYFLGNFLYQEIATDYVNIVKRKCVENWGKLLSDNPISNEETENYSDDFDSDSAAEENKEDINDIESAGENKEDNKKVEESTEESESSEKRPGFFSIFKKVKEDIL